MRKSLIVLALAVMAITSSPTLVWADGKKKSIQKTEAEKIAPRTYKITSRIELFGDIPPPPLRTFFKDYIDFAMARALSIWNKNNRFTVKGANKKVREFQLLFHIDHRLRARREKPTPGYHQIEFVFTPVDFIKGQLGEKTRLMDGYRSWMYINGRKRGISGRFALPINPATLAHEFGHLWGLRDEYPRGSFWERIWGRIQKIPHSKWPLNLMDYSTFPWAELYPRHYRKVYRNMWRYGWINRKVGKNLKKGEK